MKEGPKVILAIHVGAGGGTVLKDQQDEYRNTIRSALEAGKK
jgi:beta-aspartyl-peptidase (threonine type)